MSSDFDIDCQIQRRELLAEMESLWVEADALWDKEQNKPAFGAYVSADYLAVFNSLVELKPTSFTFLEFGSGLGVATIMASRLGYEAYGIESETELVDHSRDYAERFAPDATFTLGSFVPDDFEWDVAAGEEVHVTSIDHADAYGDMDLQLNDFDLVYAYPWPTEHELYHSILRQFGSPNCKLLIYDAREGILIY